MNSEIFSIGFDEKRKLEFFSYLSPYKREDGYVFYPCDPKPKK